MPSVPRLLFGILADFSRFEKLTCTETSRGKESGAAEGIPCNRIRSMPAPSLLLIHGAANGAWVWDAWRRHLRELGWATNVLDLRGHGRSLPVDFSAVTMEDYLADVESVTAQIT